MPEHNGGASDRSLSAELDFRILGPLEVVNRESLALGGPKQRAVLAVLLLHRGKVVTTDRLIDAVWDESLPARPHKSLQVYVSNLRKVLGDQLLVTRGRGYLLAVAADHVDAERFSVLARRGKRALERGDARRAQQMLRSALALWRGSPLGDLANERFAQPEVARLQEARLNALGDLIEAELALGQHLVLVPELEALVRTHPLWERLYGQLMLALYRSGRQADALACYQRARRQLLDELGVEPGARLKEVQHQILTQNPALNPPLQPARVRRLTTTPKSISGSGRPSPRVVRAPPLVSAALAVQAAGDSRQTRVQTSPLSAATASSRNKPAVPRPWVMSPATATRHAAVLTRPGAAGRRRHLIAAMAALISALGAIIPRSWGTAAAGRSRRTRTHGRGWFTAPGISLLVAAAVSASAVVGLSGRPSPVAVRGICSGCSGSAPLTLCNSVSCTEHLSNHPAMLMSAIGSPVCRTAGASGCPLWETRSGASPRLTSMGVAGSSPILAPSNARDISGTGGFSLVSKTVPTAGRIPAIRGHAAPASTHRTTAPHSSAASSQLSSASAPPSPVLNGITPARPTGHGNSRHDRPSNSRHDPAGNSGHDSAANSGHDSASSNRGNASSTSRSFSAARFSSRGTRGPD